MPSATCCCARRVVCFATLVLRPALQATSRGSQPRVDRQARPRPGVVRWQRVAAQASATAAAEQPAAGQQDASRPRSQV
jgi:hypothetical protein